MSKFNLKMPFRLVGLLTALLTITNVSAQETNLVSDRPGQTFASSTVESGRLQIQAGFDWNPVEGIDDIYQTPIYLRYGVTNKLEVNGALSPIYNNILEPYPSFELGLRYHLVQKDRFNLAGHIRYFNSDGLFYGSLQSYWLLINSSYTFERSSISSSFGVYRTTEESILLNNSTDVYLTLNYAVNLSEKWTLFAEFAAINFFQEKSNSAGYQLGVFEGFDYGVAWLYSPDLQFDLSTDTALGRKNGDLKLITSFVSVGVTWRIRKLK